MKRWIVVSMMMLFGLILTACGAEKDLLSPKEIVNTMLKEANEPLSYYGEYTTVSNDDSEAYKTKIWIGQDQKRRIELTTANNEDQLIVVNDGQTVTMYDKVEKTALVMPISEDELNELSNQTPQQQAEQMLDLVKDSHEFSTGDEVEIAGRSTYHIIAKKKDKKAMFGDMEMWVDKETWLPLKTKTNHAGSELMMEYMRIDYEMEMADELFTIDLPEDVVVDVLDGEGYDSEEVTIEAVKEELGSFYQLSEESGLELTKVTVLNGLEERPEFSLDYAKDGMPAISLSVFKELPNVVDFGGVEEEVVIRGRKASKMEMGEFRSLDWVEEGLKYVVLIENPEIDFEDVEQYLEEMILVE